MLFLFLFWWLFCWRSHNESRCEIKIKQRVAQSKQKGKRMRKMGHHSSRKRLCSTQNRVTDVHDTLAVCYERASVSSYDSIRYKRTPMWLQNGAIYVEGLCLGPYSTLVGMPLQGSSFLPIPSFLPILSIWEQTVHPQSSSSKARVIQLSSRAKITGQWEAYIY